MKEQSVRFGTKVISETITKVDLSSRPFKIWKEGTESGDPVLADSLIIATGATAKRVFTSIH
jgi:thioredoxin reductase (NADPH)